MITQTEIEKILNRLNTLGKEGIFKRCSSPVIKDNKVGISFDITGLGMEEADKIRIQIQDILKQNFPELEFSIILTSNRSSQGESEQSHNSQALRDNYKKKKPGKIHIDGASKVILVSSGKGGVGKSTITALLASALREQGQRVGVLDADIYGPSIPQIFGTNQKPELDDKKMVPIEAFGIQLNSIGFITAPGASISWRGPMVSKALYQLLSLTKWQELDYLLIDMPPGTGDIHISLMENYIIDGVLVVTTPQMISAIDVERSINLYKKFNTNIIGLIENMSFYLDENSGKRIELFSGLGGKTITEKFDIDLLEKLQLLPELSKSCDLGEDLGKYAKYIQRVTEKLLKLSSKEKKSVI